jgi:hypothetical protein
LVVVEGFSKHSFIALGVQVSAFTGTFFTLPGVQISPNPLGAQFENGVTEFTPQRIQIPFDIMLRNPISTRILVIRTELIPSPPSFRIRWGRVKATHRSRR